MDELIKKLGEHLAEQITSSVMKNVREQMLKMNKQNFEFCYTEEEAARKLGVNPKTLYRKRKSGEIDYSLSPSRSAVYLPKHIIDYLIRNEIRNGKSTISDEDANNFPQLKLAS